MALPLFNWSDDEIRHLVTDLHEYSLNYGIDGDRGEAGVYSFRTIWWLSTRHPNRNDERDRETFRRIYDKHANNRKESIMTTTPIDDKRLRSQIEKTRKALADLETELENRRLPAQPATGSVVRFEIEFERYSRRYLYAAARVGNAWYTTGTTSGQQRFNSWRELIDFIREAEWHGPIQVLGVKEDLAV